LQRHDTLRRSSAIASRKSRNRRDRRIDAIGASAHRRIGASMNATHSFDAQHVADKFQFDFSPRKV
jgi:hypothetical protein